MEHTVWIPGPLVYAAPVTALLAYFLGCFNGAVIVSKYILHDDVRGHGSGNAGLTNFYRTFGGPLTAVVILCDVLKAVLAVAAGTAAVYMLYGDDKWMLGDLPWLLAYAKYWTGLFCLLGHMFPCMFRFKGGKGILSGGTLAILIDWRLALVAWGGFLLLAVLTKYVSLGSCWAGASFPFMSWFVYHDFLILLLGTICGVLVLWKHRGNIQRLLNGTESKFSLHHGKQ